MDQHHKELGRTFQYEGQVVQKEYIKGEDTTPTVGLDFDGNMSVGIDPGTPDKYMVVIKYSEDTLERNDKTLYSQVEMNGTVKVNVREVYDVKKTYKGRELERELKGYQLEKIVVQ